MLLRVSVVSLASLETVQRTDRQEEIVSDLLPVQETTPHSSPIVRGVLIVHRNRVRREVRETVTIVDRNYNS